MEKKNKDIEKFEFVINSIQWIGTIILIGAMAIIIKSEIVKVDKKMDAIIIYYKIPVSDSLTIFK